MRTKPDTPVTTAPPTETGQAKALSPELRAARSRAGKMGGAKGAAARWGKIHGVTDSVRAFVPTVARFRKYVPDQRDRAAFVSAALDRAMDRAHFPKE